MRSSGSATSSADHGVVTACERALVAAARTQRAATRQQCRAAARRFVRRHRRNAAYLRFVLRSVAASSALAVALLGLGAQRASAKTPEWSVGSLPITSAGGLYEPGPVFADLDRDGDLDLVFSDGNALRYFENTGTASSPDFVERTGASNPLLDVL